MNRLRQRWDARPTGWTGSLLGAAALLLASALPASAQVLVDWTFETTAPTTSGPFSPEVNNTRSSAAATGAISGGSYSSPAGNGSTHSYSATNWSAGSYFQFALNTTGYQNIGVSFDQTGSSTGPKDFSLSYSTDGTTFTQVGTYALTVDSWNTTTYKSASTRTFDLSAVTGLNNASTVYFRVIDLDTTSINGGTVASTGSDRVDNFTVFQVPEPATYLGGVLLVSVLGWSQRRRWFGTAALRRDGSAV